MKNSKFFTAVCISAVCFWLSTPTFATTQNYSGLKPDNDVRTEPCVWMTYTFEFILLSPYRVYEPEPVCVTEYTSPDYLVPCVWTVAVDNLGRELEPPKCTAIKTTRNLKSAWRNLATTGIASEVVGSFTQWRSN